MHQATTWLCVALEHRNPSMARDAIDAGADPHHVVVEGRYACPVLLKAVLAEDLEAVLMLLERGASPNATDSYGMTALIGCANSLTWAQAPAAAAALLRAGARTDLETADGYTAMHTATATLRELASCPGFAREGETGQLGVAGALRLVEALLAHGARVSTLSMQAVIDKARSCVRCAWPPR
jgi:hypothetical protein